MAEGDTLTCTLCEGNFPSRNAIFRHLRDQTNGCGKTTANSEVALAYGEHGPTRKDERRDRLSFAKAQAAVDAAAGKPKVVRRPRAPRTKRSTELFTSTESCEVWLGGIPPEINSIKKVTASIWKAAKPGTPNATVKYYERRGYRDTLSNGKKVWMGYAFLAYRDETERARALDFLDGLQVCENFKARARPASYKNKNKRLAPQAKSAPTKRPNINDVFVSIIEFICLLLLSWFWLMVGFVTRWGVRLIDGGKHERKIAHEQLKQQRRAAGVLIKQQEDEKSRGIPSHNLQHEQVPTPPQTPIPDEEEEPELSFGTDPPLHKQLQPLDDVDMLDRIKYHGLGPVESTEKSREITQRLVNYYTEHPRREIHLEGKRVPEHLLTPCLNALTNMVWPPKKERRKVNADHYVVINMTKNYRDMYTPIVKKSCELLMMEMAPTFEFTHIAVTKNFVGSPHIDFLDTSYQYAISLGDFNIGGELCVESESNMGSEVYVADTHNKLAIVDGRYIHWVRSFGGGDRYSLIFFTNNTDNGTPKTKAAFREVEWPTPSAAWSGIC
eukprot:CFRG4984T1